MKKIELPKNIKEVLGAYEVPANVVGMIEDYFTGVVSDVGKELADQTIEPKQKERPISIRDIAEQHRKI